MADFDLLSNELILDRDQPVPARRAAPAPVNLERALKSPETASPTDLLALQKSAGNAAVSRLVGDGDKASPQAAATPATQPAAATAKPASDTADAAKAPTVAPKFDVNRLSPFGDAVQTKFKRRVCEIEIRIGLRKGKYSEYFEGLPRSELGRLASGKRLRADVAIAAQRLLDGVGEDLKRARARGEPDALRVRSIGVRSAFRNVYEEIDLWNRYFPKYYGATAATRAQARGGEHSEAAAQILAEHIFSRKAAPGYSNHTHGVAVDFETTDGGVSLGPTKEQSGLWRRSWLHRWLVRYAPFFGFKPLATEEWHWDYEDRPEDETEDLPGVDFPSALPVEYAG